MDIVSQKAYVKSFDVKRGYGFLKANEHHDEVMVHYTAIVMPTETDYKRLHAGDIVEFDAVLTDKGLKATRVQIVELAEKKPSARTSRRNT